MGKQRHDPGVRKRRQRLLATGKLDYERTNPRALADDLVRRGLASPLILDHWQPPKRHQPRREDHR